MSWRSVTALLVLAFAGGAVGFAWLSSNGGMPLFESSSTPKALPEEPETAPATAFATPPIIQPSASQAEAMLLVANARRAIEAGKPLGDLGSRLQVSFGQGQPQALATIANGLKQPISNAALLAGFDAVAPQLLLPAGTAWDRMQYEARTLFVLRSGNAKPSASQTRLNKVRQAIIAGDTAGAAKMVRAMPNAAAAADWLADANRAIAVYQALDTLNQSAASPPPVVVTPQPTSVSGQGTVDPPPDAND
jgi:hypothetical protein